MSLFRAAAGLALGGAAFGLAAWGIDPDFLVENDQIKTLATELTTKSDVATQLKDFASVVDTVPTNIPDGFHLFEGVADGGKHLLVNTEKAMPLIPGATALNEYFGLSANPEVAKLTEHLNTITTFAENKTPEAISQALANPPAPIKEAFGAVNDYFVKGVVALGDTGLQRDLSYSALSLPVGGALGLGAVGAFQGNNQAPVVGRFTEQETLRRQAIAARGGQLPPGYDVSELSQSADRPHTIAPQPMPQQAHAASVQQPGGSKVADYLRAMKEASDPAHAAPGGRGA